MDPWNPILKSPVTEFEEMHASIRDQVSVSVVALIGVTLLLGWLFV